MAVAWNGTETSCCTVYGKDEQKAHAVARLMRTKSEIMSVTQRSVRRTCSVEIGKVMIASSALSWNGRLDVNGMAIGLEPVMLGFAR